MADQLLNMTKTTSKIIDLPTNTKGKLKLALYRALYSLAVKFFRAYAGAY